MKMFFQRIPNVNDLNMSDTDLDPGRMECGKQLYLVPSLVDTTSINH